MISRNLLQTNVKFALQSNFCQVEQRSPKGLESVVGERCCSFDGDADRVMYFFNDGDRFRMLDGDKIATLGKTRIS